MKIEEALASEDYELVRQVENKDRAVKRAKDALVVAEIIDVLAKNQVKSLYIENVFSAVIKKVRDVPVYFADSDSMDSLKADLAKKNAELDQLLSRSHENVNVN